MSIEKLAKDSNMVVNLVITVAIGLIFLSKMSTTSGVGSDAQTALSTAVGYVDDYIDWIALIILIGVIVYLKKKAGSATQ